MTSSYTPQLTLDTLSGLELYISNTAYDSAGRMVTRSLGNGVTQTHTYHPWSTDGGRLAGISAGTVQNLGYTYDDGGNILSIVDAIAGPQTQSFGYDALNRLTSADATGGLDGWYAETYGYDGNTGNLAAKAGLTYTYGDSAHPHAVTGLSDGSTYTYDANGSMISRTRNGVTTTFTYNGENKLVLVQEGGNTIAQFLYDGDGVRVQSTINGVTTQFVGEYYEISGTDVTKYYGGQTAMRVNGIISYLLADHLGSNALILDSSGNVVGETRYEAWGEIRYASGSSTDYTYTGQYSNTSDFGWMFYKARWYDPYLNRWTQPDTIIPNMANSQDWDRYGYVRNNPIKFNDPNGHDVGCAGSDADNCLGLNKPKNRSGYSPMTPHTKSRVAESILGRNKTTWDEAAPEYREALSADGWDQYSWDHSDYIGPGVRNAYWYEDPAVYISLILAGGTKTLIIPGVSSAMSQLAYSCFRNPLCGKIVFGLPTTYASRLDKQLDSFHNFPRMLDPIIMQNGERIVKGSKYILYRLEGEVAKMQYGDGYKLYQGVFEIGVELKGLVPVITHTFFNPK